MSESKQFIYTTTLFYLADILTKFLYYSVQMWSIFILLNINFFFWFYDFAGHELAKIVILIILYCNNQRGFFSDKSFFEISFFYY